MIAATGPRNLRLAGAIADIAQVQVGVNPSAIQWALDRVVEGAESVGRDPTEVEVSVLCAMWVSDDVELARNRCRWAASTAANHIAAVMRQPDHGMPKELTRVVEERSRKKHEHNYNAHLGNSEAETGFLTDDMIDDFAIAGPANMCRERIAQLATLGAAEVAAGYLNGESRQIKSVGDEIIAPFSLRSMLRRDDSGEAVRQNDGGRDDGNP
jgi:5,10-methylenetetrahydromethanopterin reductase